MDQKIEVRGTVVRDPELRKTAAGKPWAKLSIAADEVTKNGEELDPQQHKWQTAVFWEKRAQEVAAEFRKGDNVQVSGKAVDREYADKTGTQRTAAEILNFIG